MCQAADALLGNVQAHGHWRRTSFAAARRGGQVDRAL
jgi:hypothetical protein